MLRLKNIGRSFLTGFCLLLGLLVSQTSLANPEDVLAQKDGYQLRMKHFEAYLIDLVRRGEFPASPTEDQLQNLGVLLVEIFMNQPQEVVSLIEATAGMAAGNDANSDSVTYQPESTAQSSMRSTDASALAAGHQFIRTRLGNDIGEMNFDSNGANEFRRYLATSLLYSGSGSSTGGVNGDSFSESNTQIQFCGNGTYQMVSSGSLSISVPGMSMSGSGDSDVQNGYWEVATLPNSLSIILFYSNEPSMLEESENGFLPFPVQQYNNQYVLMPNGGGYSRTSSSGC